MVRLWISFESVAGFKLLMLKLLPFYCTYFFVFECHPLETPVAFWRSGWCSSSLQVTWNIEEIEDLTWVLITYCFFMKRVNYNDMKRALASAIFIIVNEFHKTICKAAQMYDSFYHIHVAHLKAFKPYLHYLRPIYFCENVTLFIVTSWQMTSFVPSF